MVCQIFFLPQGKWWAIITYKHGIRELRHELLNDLILAIVKVLLKLEIKLSLLCAVSHEN